jgi:hypothetical protein
MSPTRDRTPMQLKPPTITAGTLALLLTSCAAIRVSDVSVQGPQTALASGTITVYANANVAPGPIGGNRAVNWSVPAGGASITQASAQTALIKLPAASVETQVVIQAAAQQDNQTTGKISIAVLPSNSSLPSGDFSNSNQRWDSVFPPNAKEARDAIRPPLPAVHTASEGNPGGTLRGASDGFSYFVAPAEYLGSQTQFAGKTLKFDLRMLKVAAQPPGDDIIITGAGLTLVAAFSTAPTTAWTAYSIPFSSGVWRVGSLAGAVATDVQIAQTLGFLDRIWIRSGYGFSNSGIVTTSEYISNLDNVRIVP